MPMRCLCGDNFPTSPSKKWIIMLYFNVIMYLQWNFEMNLLSKSKVLLSSTAIFFY